MKSQQIMLEYLREKKDLLHKKKNVENVNQGLLNMISSKVVADAAGPTPSINNT